MTLQVGDTVLIYSTPRQHRSYGLGRKRNHMTNMPSPTRPHSKQPVRNGGSHPEMGYNAHRGQNNLQSLFRREGCSASGQRAAVSGIKDSMNGCINCREPQTNNARPTTSKSTATKVETKPKDYGGARPKVKIINGLKGLTKSVTLFDATITESSSDTKRLTLLKCKCRPEAQASPYPWPTSGPQPKKNTLQMYVLDISQATTQAQVSWLPVPDSTSHQFHERPLCGTIPQQHGPPADSTIMSSLTAARGELVMFGGLVENRNQSLLRGRGSSLTWDYKAVNKIYFSF